jgi:hypothetical protein
MKRNVSDEDDDFDFLDQVNVTENILNGNFYLHICILEAIHALSKGIEKGSAKDGITLRIVSVDDAENIAEAKGIINRSDVKYKKMIKDFEDKLDGSDDDLVKKAKIAGFKLGKLLSEIKEREPKKGDVII